jgi:hypothetical protein
MWAGCPPPSGVAIFIAIVIFIASSLCGESIQNRGRSASAGKGSKDG